MYPSDMQLFQVVFGQPPVHRLVPSEKGFSLPPTLREHDQGTNFWLIRDQFVQRFILQFTQ